MQKKKLGRVVIVGAGAVGGYYGARLAAAGEDVTFLLRADYAYVNQHGLEVQSVAGDLRLPQVQCAQTSAEIGEADLVIIAWKATANDHLEEVLRPLVGAHTILLTLQNGLGNCERLAELYGAERVLGGLCFVCINRIAPGVISHTAAGLIRIGEYAHSGVSARLEQIVDRFTQAGVPCEAVSSLEKALWMKLVWNIPFNGLAIAEGGVDTQIILQERGLEPEVRALMQEVVAVASALGHTIPPAFVEKQLEITHPMGPYRPSSMIDYVQDRPVEYEAIWGHPLQVAHRLNVPVPHMQALADRIHHRLNTRSNAT